MVKFRGKKRESAKYRPRHEVDEHVGSQRV